MTPFLDTYNVVFIDTSQHHRTRINSFWKLPLQGNSIVAFRLNEDSSFDQKPFSLRKGFLESVKLDAKRALEVLRQDGPGLDASQQEGYRHTVNAYHLTMDIYAKCEEFKASWRLVDEMIEKGYPVTARTFNILIRTCGEAGLAKTLVESFIKSKNFNFFPYKHSYNAILHSFLVLKQYKLIEWVYDQMRDDFSPDILTYNIVLYAKYRLGKVDQFNILFAEMGRNGFSPDLHTYNILLHALGKEGKPLEALKLLNHMRETGQLPSASSAG
ncbi:hypothetical protein TSUD_44650 [Trifolium subterraneum]|nr:hypothetical protein TSUD_44650 [Trifolium subterraneum]